jgi:hypothetical protein
MTDSNVCSLFRILEFSRVSVVRHLFAALMMSNASAFQFQWMNFYNWTLTKFGEKFITYTNQIYRLISKLRRVCRITTHDLHRWDNSQTDEIRRNDDKYWYFLMIFFVDRCNLSYLNFHVNMLSMASLWNCKAESHLWFTNPWYIFLTNKSH